MGGVRGRGEGETIFQAIYASAQDEANISPMDNILCSDWLPEQARWAYLNANFKNSRS